MSLTNPCLKKMISIMIVVPTPRLLADPLQVVFRHPIIFESFNIWLLLYLVTYVFVQHIEHEVQEFLFRSLMVTKIR